MFVCVLYAVYVLYFVYVALSMNEEVYIFLVCKKIGPYAALVNVSTFKGKGKGRCIALKEQTPHRATERHLPYGITHCYLPPDRGERVPP